MKAVVTSDWTEGIIDLTAGDEVEVVGFVQSTYMTKAVYIDRDGYFAELPASRLRVKAPEQQAEDDAFAAARASLAGHRP